MHVQTPVGAAGLTWWRPSADEPSAPGPRPAATGLLLLGHGAGGGIHAPDLQRTASVADQLGYAVGLVEQPYRMAGKRMAAPAAQLDVAFAAVIAYARAQLHRPSDFYPMVLGGRSSGARVACRTAVAAGARGVLALAFPLQPVRRSGQLGPSRRPELAGAGVPVLVVQGERDGFGSDEAIRAALLTPDPSAEADITVLTAPGADHALRKGVPWPEIGAWLAARLP